VRFRTIKVSSNTFSPWITTLRWFGAVRKVSKLGLANIRGSQSSKLKSQPTYRLNSFNKLPKWRLLYRLHKMLRWRMNPNSKCSQQQPKFSRSPEITWALHNLSWRIDPSPIRVWAQTIARQGPRLIRKMWILLHIRISNNNPQAPFLTLNERLVRFNIQRCSTRSFPSLTFLSYSRYRLSSPR